MDYTIECKPSYSLVEVTLSSGETIVADSGAMAWMSSNVRMETSTRGGILKGLALIVGLADNLALVDDDAADRHFAGIERLFGLAQGNLHVSKVVIDHGWRFSPCDQTLSSPHATLT